MRAGKPGAGVAHADSSPASGLPPAAVAAHPRPPAPAAPGLAPCSPGSRTRRTWGCTPFRGSRGSRRTSSGVSERIHGGAAPSRGRRQWRSRARCGLPGWQRASRSAGKDRRARACGPWLASYHDRLAAAQTRIGSLAGVHRRESLARIGSPVHDNGVRVPDPRTPEGVSEGWPGPRPWPRRGQVARPAAPSGATVPVDDDFNPAGLGHAAVSGGTAGTAGVEPCSGTSVPSCPCQASTCHSRCICRRCRATGGVGAWQGRRPLYVRYRLRIVGIRYSSNARTRS